MADRSKIDATWNPIAGCSIVSKGCTHCYAMRQAHRMASNPATPHYAGTTKVVNGKPVWTGKVALAPEKTLTAPLRWRKPCRVFVNSMSDLFHEDVPDEWIDKVFAVMALCPQHTFQVLTKRPTLMWEYVTEIVTNPIRGMNWGAHACVWMESAGLAAHVFNKVPEWPLPNVWLGVSAEDQPTADERIPILRDTPAALRLISFEPLLAPIINQDLTGIHWVIVGGESGPGARPVHPDWVRSLRDQCQAPGVAFFFKQWGAWAPHRPTPGGDLGGDVRRGHVMTVHPGGETLVEVSRMTGGRSTLPGSRYMAKVGKKRAGALLDGRKHHDRC